MRKIANFLMCSGQDWMDKVVTNPSTGRRVKVRSLPKELRDKYKPKNDSKNLMDLADKILKKKQEEKKQKEDESLKKTLSPEEYKKEKATDKVFDNAMKDVKQKIKDGDYDHRDVLDGIYDVELADFIESQGIKKDDVDVVLDEIKYQVDKQYR